MNLGEEYYKYFLYRLIDRVLSEIRFEVSTNSNDLNKIYMFSNFIIDLPLELQRFGEEKLTYQEIFQGYYEYSRRLKIDKWFDNEVKQSYQIYSLRKENDKKST